MSIALQECPTAETLPIPSKEATEKPSGVFQPLQSEDGRQWVRSSAMLPVKPETLYEIWSDIENLPAWQPEIVEVRRTGPKTSHWVMRSGGHTVQWDAEVLADEPGKRIAWRSIGGDLKQAGEVVFEAQPAGQGTMVTVSFQDPHARCFPTKPAEDWT